jgi:NADH dehydrogenase
MKVCVTGSTGFVGQGVVPVLLNAGMEVHTLVRTSSIDMLPTNPACSVFVGNPLDQKSVEGALVGCDALVHLVGARKKQLKVSGQTYADIDVVSVHASLAAMKQCGVDRIILLSAGALGKSVYVQTKAIVEQLVKDAEARWTILRPAFIIGPGQQWPVVMSPFLSGMARLPGHLGEVARRAQNVHRKEIARTIAWSLEYPESVGKILEVAEIRRLGKGS